VFSQAEDGIRDATVTGVQTCALPISIDDRLTDEGPCLDCFRTGKPVVNCTLGGTNLNWPNFAPQALEAGFLSVHALPMRLRGLRSEERRVGEEGRGGGSRVSTMLRDV